MWPEGIGVRRYKFFSNKRNDNAGKTSNFTNKNNQFVTENSNGSGYARYVAWTDVTISSASKSVAE